MTQILATGLWNGKAKTESVVIGQRQGCGKYEREEEEQDGCFTANLKYESCGEHGGGYLVSHEGTKPRRGEKITVAG